MPKNVGKTAYYFSISLSPKIGPVPNNGPHSWSSKYYMILFILYFSVYYNAFESGISLAHTYAAKTGNKSDSHYCREVPVRNFFQFAEKTGI